MNCVGEALGEMRALSIPEQQFCSGEHGAEYPSTLDH